MGNSKQDRGRIAFGNSRILSLGSENAMVIGHGSPLQVEQYRSPQSWVGRSKPTQPSR